jgi:hypothetical protein
MPLYDDNEKPINIYSDGDDDDEELIERCSR